MNPVKELLQKKRHDENYLKQLHHLLIQSYGWIPLAEFKQLPIPMIVNLVDEILMDREMEAEGEQKAIRRSKTHK